MNNPFDLKNYKPQISMRDVNTASKTSYQQTQVINRRRAKGDEPSIVYSTRGRDTQPKKFVTVMPDMPYHPSTIRLKRKKTMSDINVIAIANKVYGEKTQWNGIQRQRLLMLAERLISAEREACARIAEEWQGPTKDRELHIAAAIRARGGNEQSSN